MSMHIMTSEEALRFIAHHGIVLEAARGPVPNLLEVALGSRPRGSWWAHPHGREFFALTRAIRRSPNVLVCRLVQGNVTFIHCRLWPAVARLERRFGARALQAVEEVHTPSGTHRVRLTSFRRRVPAAVLAAAGKLTVASALEALGPCLSLVADHRARGSA